MSTRRSSAADKDKLTIGTILVPKDAAALQVTYGGYSSIMVADINGELFTLQFVTEHGDVVQNGGYRYSSLMSKFNIASGTGNVNTGDVTTGNVTTGDVTTGDVNTGDVNTGGVNTGDVNTGIVNTGIVTTGIVTTGNHRRTRGKITSSITIIIIISSSHDHNHHHLIISSS